jgi:hypothetical protein
MQWDAQRVIFVVGCSPVGRGHALPMRRWNVTLEPFFACEVCGMDTAGDALCVRCLGELEQAAHPPFPRQALDASHTAVMVARIRDRLREHLAQRPPCPHCAASPSLVVDLLDAEQASAEIVLSLDTLARLSRDPRFELDSSVLTAIADAVRRWHAVLAAHVERLGALALDPLPTGGP